jgi:hypothetical protein
MTHKKRKHQKGGVNNPLLAPQENNKKSNNQLATQENMTKSNNQVKDPLVAPRNNSTNNQLATQENNNSTNNNSANPSVNDETPGQPSLKLICFKSFKDIQIENFEKLELALADLEQEYKTLMDSQDENCNIDFKKLHIQLEESTNLLKYAIIRLKNDELKPKSEQYYPRAKGSLLARAFKSSRIGKKTKMFNKSTYAKKLGYTPEYYAKKKADMDLKKASLNRKTEPESKAVSYAMQEEGDARLDFQKVSKTNDKEALAAATIRFKTATEALKKAERTLEQKKISAFKEIAEEKNTQKEVQRIINLPVKGSFLTTSRSNALTKMINKQTNQMKKGGKRTKKGGAICSKYNTLKTNLAACIEKINKVISTKHDGCSEYTSKVYSSFERARNKFDESLKGLG